MICWGEKTNICCQYHSKYGLEHEAMAHTEQLAIDDPNVTCVKPPKLRKQRSYMYKKARQDTQL